MKNETFNVPGPFTSDVSQLSIFRKVAWHLLLKIAVLPGQTEIAKAEKMHGPGTLNVSFFIRSGLKMKVKV